MKNFFTILKETFPKIILSALMLLCGISSQAQIIDSILGPSNNPDVNSATTVAAYGPFCTNVGSTVTSWTYRAAYIYRYDHIEKVSNGTVISALDFYKSAKNSSGNNVFNNSAGRTVNYKIYLKNISTNAWPGNITWATEIASGNATLVFDGDPTTIVTAGAGWKTFTFSNPFTFNTTNGTNLAVLIEYSHTGGSQPNIYGGYDWSTANSGAAPAHAVTNESKGKYTSGAVSNVATVDNTTGADTRRPVARLYLGPLVPPTITGFNPNPVCEGSGAVISITGTHFTGVTSVSFNGTPAVFSVIDTLHIDATLPAGATTGTITVTNSSGTATSTVLTITPLPAAPGVISGPVNVCAGNSATYSVTAVSGATSYTWNLPNGWTGTSTTNSITVNAVAGSGSIAVTADNNCGSSSPQVLAVNGVVPLGAGSISGATSVCPNDVNVYLTTLSGADSYTWTLPAGWSGNSTSSSVVATAGFAGGDITVMATNACGNSAVQTLTIVLNSSPSTPASISGPVTLCENSSATYSVAQVIGASSYTWTLPSGWSGSSTDDSIVVTAGASGGTISVIAVSGCGNSSPQTISVSSAAAIGTPGNIVGAVSLCSGLGSTYSVTAVSGAISYTWTLPLGWTGTSTTETINVTAGSGAGVISVTANSSCGSSAAQTLAVSNGTVPTPGNISGPDTVCGNTQATYSVAPVSGATVYNWTLPNGWTGTSTTESIHVTTNANGGLIQVSITSACGTSTPQSFSVSQGSLPGMPGTISGEDTICSGTSGVTFSISNVSGATSYIWTLPNGWTGSSTTATISTVPGTSGGIISVSAANTCGGSSAQTLNVVIQALPVVTLSLANTSVCDSSASFVLTGGTPTGGTYSGTGVTANSFDPSIGAGNSTITYTYTDAHNCSSSANQNITISSCFTVVNEVSAERILVFPNPFIDELVIQFPGIHEKTKAVLTDITGRAIAEIMIESGTGETHMHTAYLQAGIYLLSFIENDHLVFAPVKLFTR